MNNSNLETPQKPKKQLSAEQLEKLKVAREKALAVRQNNAKNKALEKELANAEKEQHLNSIKEKLAKVKGKAEPKQETPKVEIVESEPEEEPEVVVKKKSVKPKKKKIVIVEDSESDEEQQQVIFVKRKKEPVVSKPVEAPPQPQAFQTKLQPQEDPYERQYNAIFGNPRRF
jgi:hypothetical protein